MKITKNMKKNKYHKIINGRKEEIKMTKKDYILIANALVKSNQTVAPVPAHYIRRVAINLSDALIKDNSRFNKLKFIDYINKGLK